MRLASIIVKPDPVVNSSTTLKGTLNVADKQVYPATMDTRTQQLLLILPDARFRYCLYRVPEPEDSDESATLELGEPLVTMDISNYPDSMSFAAVGTSIYMAGGYSGESDPSRHYSDNTFILDTLSKDIVPGPKLLSGKPQPCLLTLGSKIYALPLLFFRPGTRDPEHVFEALDTENLERGWFLLPCPPIRFSKNRNLDVTAAYAAAAHVAGATSSAIFMSLGYDVGTYAFDVDTMVWSYVSEDSLPFDGYGTPMPPSPNLPCAPSLCCATSNKSHKLAAFRFHYYANEGDRNGRVFQVDEIEIDSCSLPSQELSPSLYHVWRTTAHGSFGRSYFVEVGVDNPEATSTYIGNRYVKVTAAEFCKVVKPNKGELFKRCKKNKCEMEYDKKDETSVLDLNEGQVVKKCKKEKRGMGGDEEETITLKLEKGKSLNRCRNKKRRQMGHDDVEDEARDFKVTPIWRRSFFTGEIVDIPESSSAAFAI